MSEELVIPDPFPHKPEPDLSPYITVTEGLSGWFAVHVWWNPDIKCWEPYDTGVGRYPELGPAVKEAREWAEAEGMRLAI